MALALELISSVLSASALQLAKEVVRAYKRHQESRVQQVSPSSFPPQHDERTLESLTPERIQLVEEEIRLLEESGSSFSGVTGATALPRRYRYPRWPTPQKQADLESVKELGALVLAVSPQAVFQDSRKRISLVFRINLAVSIALAVILLAGIGGAVFSALFLRNAVWSLVFGGISAADVIGAYIFKPLSAINAALVTATRLDALQLRLSQQLTQCAQHKNLEERILCQTKVWEAIQRELAIIGGTPQPSSDRLAKRLKKAAAAEKAAKSNEP